MYEEGKIDADGWTNRNRRLHKRGPSGPKNGILDVYNLWEHDELLAE